MTSCHGFLLWWSWLLTKVLNSQNEMMSCACGRNAIGKILFFIPGTNDAAISGVNDDVAHVSKTSFSGMNSFPLHFGHSFIVGLSFNGSTGSCFSSASMGSSHFAQYHTGKGTPKNRCLEMHQSHCNPLTQLSNRFFICSGYQLRLFPASKNCSLKSR